MRDPRLIRVPGIYAGLDLGGLPTTDGGHTALGRVIRVDHMLPVYKDETSQGLRELGVGVVLDLRSMTEREKRPAHLSDEPGVTHHHIPLGDDFATPGVVMPSSLTELYARLFMSHGPTLATIVGVLARHRDEMTLVHCRSGRDRTGVVAALVLRLCGVPTRAILADQARVGELGTQDVGRRRARWVARGRDPKVFDRLNSFEVIALARAMHMLDTEYGGAAAYLRAHGLEEETLHHAAMILRERGSGS